MSHGADAIAAGRVPVRGKRCRHEHAIGVLPELGPRALGRAWRDREVQAELPFQLVVPLRNQRIGDEDQHPASQAPQQVLTQQETGFDRLAQPHFVRQQHATTEPAQRLPHCLDLIRQMLDAVHALQAQQLVKAAHQLQVPQRQMQRELIARGLPPLAAEVPIIQSKPHGYATGRAISGHFVRALNGIHDVVSPVPRSSSSRRLGGRTYIRISLSGACSRRQHPGSGETLARTESITPLLVPAPLPVVPLFL